MIDRTPPSRLISYIVTRLLPAVQWPRTNLRLVVIGLMAFLALTAGPARAQFGSGSELISAVRENLLAEARQSLIKGQSANTRTGDGTPVLILAAQLQHRTMGHLLLQEGARVNDRDKQGETALTTVTRNNDGAFAELLLAFSADPNVPGARGETPLIIAVSRGATDIVRLLISNGADVNLGDYTGRTPLASAEQGGMRGIAQLLREAGATY